MKRGIVMLIVAALLCCCPSLMAQGRGKGGGKGNAAEKAQEVREARQKAGKKAEEAREKGKKAEEEAGEAVEEAEEAGEAVEEATKQPGAPVGKGPEAAMLRQMEREEAKHRKRLANLERVHDLLLEKGNDTAAGRLEKVLGKENRRHERVMLRLENKSQAAAGRFRNKLEAIDKSRGKGAGRGRGQGGGQDGLKGGKKDEGADEDEDEEEGDEEAEE